MPKTLFCRTFFALQIFAEPNVALNSGEWLSLLRELETLRECPLTPANLKQTMFCSHLGTDLMHRADAQTSCLW